MKKISVSPTKEVNGVKFGSSKEDVRRKFGTPKSSKKSKIDDFGEFIVHYDDDGKMECVECSTECNVFVDNSKVFPLSSLEIMSSKLKLDKNYINTEKAVGITIHAGKAKTIIFGKKGYYMGETDKSSKDDKKKDKSKTEIKESGPTDLNQLYDDLQSGLNKRSETSPMMNVGNGPSPIGIEHPGASAWRAMASKECEKLKDDCRKHIILDIYCKILPLDDDFKDANMGQMAGDVNSMLAAKNMSATQYLTSASEQTKSPLVEYVLRMTDLIGKQFMENANETLEDAQEKGLEIPAPESPTTDDEEVSGQLVDIKNDVSYQTFVDELKKKTVNKIVDDVSKIINDKKEENELAFDPKPNVEDQEAVTESAVSVGLNYIQSRFMKESVEISASAYEDMIGLAMREAALNQIDLVFNIPDGKFNNFATTVRLGHGAVINESAIDAFIESAKSPEEVKKVIDDAKKESDKKIDSNLKASDIVNAKSEDDGKDKKKQPTKLEKDGL